MSPNKDPKTAPDELHRQLAYLNLPFIQEHVEELAGQAAEKQWSHVDFLGRRVEGEAALRQDRSRIRRIQQARFPVLKTLDQFDFTWPAKINRLAVQNLFRLKFIEDRANALLVGGVGLGKSHLAIVLTTNKAFKQWPSIFCNDATLTSAILDRILHHAQIVVIEGKSFRMKDRIEP